MKTYTKEEYELANKTTQALFNTTLDNVLESIVKLTGKSPDKVMEMLIDAGKEASQE